jgi:hypothetical protein
MAMITAVTVLTITTAGMRMIDKTRRLMRISRKAALCNYVLAKLVLKGSGETHTVKVMIK